ncbi:hypothetical protein DE146DRAFT_631127 [Phaeosphaeria sp. MPI-PUGE-AT-0046c]|nr:hypothetical protein DE146DRAFT_631127 [Phaeosphaeria sp. MPI-PUGE-AT-0046c]
MRVIEKGTDRTAVVNINVDGRVKPLEEYGEYVDPDDKAICCYVPVEVKQKIKFSGKFSGTTQVIWYDAVIDGVHRKASSYSAKTISHQKNKKLDTEKFMYMTTTTDPIETDMIVGEMSTGVVITPGEMTETIGTIELRIYITRQPSVTYTPRGIEKYDSLGNGDDEVQRAEFKAIPPTLQMTFEEDATPMEHAKINREQRKLDDERPGKEPWAIFRFHYRTMESIDERNLKLSFDPFAKRKDQPEPRVLDLEPVPPLPVTAKKDEGDAASTKTSSPAPPDTPLTSIREDSAKPTPSPASAKKAEPKPAITPAREMTLELKECSLAIAIPTPGGDKALTDGGSDKSAPSIATSIDTEAVSKSEAAAEARNHTTSGSPPKEEEEVIASDTIVVAMPNDQRTKSMLNWNAENLSMLPLPPRATDDTPKKNTTVAVVIPPKVFKHRFAPQKQPQNKLTPIKIPQRIAEVKPTTTARTPTTPTKRWAPPMNSTIPDIKRTKITAVPTPITPPMVSRMPPGSPSPSPRPLSIERKVADQRKALEVMRQKRQEAANRRAELDKKLKPYQQKMEDELERLRLEMLEEEVLAAEYDEHLKASEAMLAEFERAEGGK